MTERALRPLALVPEPDEVETLAPVVVIGADTVFEPAPVVEEPAPAPSAPSAAEPPHRSRAAALARQLTLLPFLRTAGSMLLATVKNAWSHRFLGLASEAAFWQLVSLPAALVGLVGMLGYVGRALGTGTVNSIEAYIVSGASQALTPSAVNTVVTPLLDQLLRQGRASLVSVGFIVSLWSGSSAVATYVNTITIAYDQRDIRGPIKSRLLALRLYVYGLMIGVILLPALVLGPGLLRKIGPPSAHHAVGILVSALYWPVVILLSLALLASLYHRAPPVRTSWFHAMPGALLAVSLWVGGSDLLRLYVRDVVTRTLDLGALAAPIAVLLFFYVTALAVLLGAEMNAEFSRRLTARALRKHPLVEAAAA